MKRSEVILILRIHIRTISNSLFGSFNISFLNSIVNCKIWWQHRCAPHLQHGYDCCHHYFHMPEAI